MARLPYLNTAPFYLGWEDIERTSEGRWAPVVLPPRQLGLAAEAGEVDAGVMALADLIRLEKTFEPLIVYSAGAPVTFGIANWTWVESVFLFLRDPTRVDPPVGRLSHPQGKTLTQGEAGLINGARIGVTGETSTSFRLLRLLLEVRHGVRPLAYERMDLEQFRADVREESGTPGGSETPVIPITDSLGTREIVGALVIGDTALRWRHRPPEGFYLAMDLASEWHDWTGLPFVFARWGIRRSLSDAHKRWLGDYLEESLRASRDRLPELVRDLPEDLGSKDELVNYLRNFTYLIGPVELEAANRFRSLLAEHAISLEG